MVMHIYPFLPLKCLSRTLLITSVPLPQIFSLAVVLLWLLVGTRTAISSASGKIFYAPCVAEYEKERIKKEFETGGGEC
jgi:hypothetical protein